MREERIAHIVRNLEIVKDEARKGWKDDNQMKFYSQHLKPISDGLISHSRMVENMMTYLYQSKKEIDSFLDRPISSVDPEPGCRERPDRITESFLLQRLKNNSR